MAPVKLPSASSLPVLFGGVVAVIAVVVAVPGWFSTDASMWLLLFLLPVVLLSERSSLKVEGSLATAAFVALGLVVAYALQKMVFGALAPDSALPGLYQSIWCALLFSGLLFAYWLLRQETLSPLGLQLYRNLYAGFYLDEWSTRVTLSLWPARLPQRAALRKPISFLEPEKTS
jgi:NAD(P)H-quinone oxidoreductase subunit 5